MNLTAKLQHIVKQEINRASDPSINPLLKINSVLDATTVKILEFKKLMKISDDKNCINGCSKYFARLAQGQKKKIILYR